MPVELVRRSVRRLADSGWNREPNPGLVIRRGLQRWDGAGQGGAGADKERLIARLAGVRASGVYEWAFDRWCKATTGEAFDAQELALVGRLYIGLSRDNPLETGVSLSHAFGMPLLPGSALKGVARAAARAAGMDAEVETYLFGSNPDETGADEADHEVAAVVFHDAWWVPCGDAKPFALERVTPHHTEYYAGAIADATDFDSPVPAAQIAVQGAFRFVVEGPEGWRALAMGMLVRALTLSGVGGKTTSGYGLFAAP
ncbi:MAG: hypothetical protein KatS3mg126_0912 [Lysobacteraceae bacterium]|nr:MAG: hypothetical protein KatS3mg126_0912 [Xanthomonadaceae bacterium]